MKENGRKVPLSQQAYDIIRYKIVSLELEPGAVIDEAELRAELKLGRTPIREALQRLARENLVSIIPRRGMFVTDIGITDLQRLFEVRIVLECTAARIAAARGTINHWSRMAQLLENVSDSSFLDNQSLIQVDEACHKIIYEATDNIFLRETLNTLYALSLRLWYFSLADVGDMEGAVAEHYQIMEALKAGNGELSARLMTNHIQKFQEEIQAVMLGVS